MKLLVLICMIGVSSLFAENKPGQTTTFEQDIARDVDNKLNTILKQQKIQKEIVQKEAINKEDYPVMIGGYEISKKKRVVKKEVLAVDTKGNYYSLSGKNNNIVQNIKVDDGYVIYKTPASGRFKSTAINYNLSNKIINCY